MAAADIGVTLQLMPMLLGFLTYKGAVIARGALDLFADLSGGGEGAANQAAAAATASGKPGAPLGALATHAAGLACCRIGAIQKAHSRPRWLHACL